MAPQSSIDIQFKGQPTITVEHDAHGNLKEFSIPDDEGKVHLRFTFDGSGPLLAQPSERGADEEELIAINWSELPRLTRILEAIYEVNKSGEKCAFEQHGLTLPEGDGWIDVNERQPKVNVTVEAWRPFYGLYHRDFRQQDGNWYLFREQVTHWRPCED